MSVPETISVRTHEPITREHTFLLRFIAVLGILSMHFFTEYLNVIWNNGTPILSFVTIAFVLNAFKFATIFFFLISGYCFQLNAKSYSNKSFKDFLEKKWLTLLRPYVFLFLLPVTILCAFVMPYIGAQRFDVNLYSILVKVFQEVFLSNYWFIPVLFVYFVLNYFIRDKKLINCLIWVSFSFTVFYGVNVYAGFLKHTEHTLAFPGFLFFFLLGRRLAMTSLPKLLTQNWLLIMITFVALCCSVLESCLLRYNFLTKDYLNTLRFSNVVYSCSFFFLMLRLLHQVRVPSRLYQINTYFIYLVHPYLTRLLSFIVLNGYFNAYSSLPVAVMVAVAGVISCIVLEQKLLPSSKLLTDLMRGKTTQMLMPSLRKWTKSKRASPTAI